MSDSENKKLSDCGCCDDEIPRPLIYNRPGLSELSYRVGTFAAFFKRMSSKLGTFVLPDGPNKGSRPLSGLSTRSQEDPSIALLDASAVVGDVLTFYQERIANEGFLRTAGERRSILEMARAIGYELNPGVSASTYLAFTVDDAPGAPGKATVEARTKVQSVPPQDKLPQTFETSETIYARKEWNAIKPRLTTQQNLTTGVAEIFLKGTDSGLKSGDMLLIVSGAQSAPVRVKEIKVDFEKKVTRVILSQLSAAISSFYASSTMAFIGKIPFNSMTVQMEILGKSWADKDLKAFMTENEWDTDELLDYMSEYRKSFPDVIGSVYALRVRLGIFGNNAPKYKSLPASLRVGERVKNKDGTEVPIDPTYPNNWETRSVNTDSQGNPNSAANFFLERPLSSVKKDDWVVLESPSTAAKGYKISKVVETSLSDYAMSAKVTGINVVSGSDLGNYKTRETTAYVQSEELDLVEKTDLSNLMDGQDELLLNSLVLGLTIGNAVVLTGERADAKGLLQSEALILKEINHINGYTRLKFETGLQYSYKRETVRINANVSRATHGETASDILGNGNGSLSNQKFTLKKPPLTYIKASTPSGSLSSLEIRVNNILWNEVSSLYSLRPRDENFTVRIDDDGVPTVIFGDGIRGARLPTGVNNVRATYRSGIGLVGEVDANTLTTLQSRPLGLREVTNPLPASGGDDPEKMENARTNAPLTVRTLERIVSLQDYDDFARSFAGIGKAQAVALWVGEHRLVHLTVASASGKQVSKDDRDTLVTAIKKARDPSQRVTVDGYDSLLFNLKAKVVIDDRFIVKDVLAVIEQQLKIEFAFEKRGFGQPVTTAEVITVMQGVKGVIAVDLDELNLSTGSAGLNQILPSGIAHLDGSTLVKAQLLLINPLGIKLLEVES